MDIKDRFRRNIFALITLCFILFLFTGFILQIYFIRSVSSYQKKSKMENIKTAFTALAKKYTEFSEGILTFIINDDNLKRCFLNRDRQGLYRALEKTFSELKKKSGIEQLHFHLKDGVSFLRLHLPGKYGDKIYSYRKMVLYAHKHKVKVSGIERGFGGLGFRVIMPVIHNGELFGSIEVGSGFRKKFFADFSSHTNSSFALFAFDRPKQDKFSLVFKQFDVYKDFTRDEIAKIASKREIAIIEKSSKVSCNYFVFPVRSFDKRVSGFFISCCKSKNDFYNVKRQIAFSVIICLVEMLFIVVISLLWGKVRKLNKKLEAKNDYINNLLKSKDKFLSIISHDIRAPFSNILGYSQLLRNSENLAEKDKKHVEMIHKSVKYQLEYVDELLELIRYDYDDIVLKKEQIDLCELVRDCVFNFNVTADAKDIEIITQAGDAVFVNGDKSKMIQVLNNLISNAIKFTPRAGKINVGCFLNAYGKIEVHIADTGVGIPKTEVGKIFKEGKKYNLPGTEGEKTIGLGLLICKKIIDLHGGKIGVKSEENRGSDFFFIL